MIRMSKNVLIVGYGVIGIIKASLYVKLGWSVFILDVDPYKKNLAISDGLRLHKEGENFSQYSLIDISTPSGTHISILKKIFENYQLQSFPYVIVEKPLYSSLYEKQELIKFLSYHPTLKSKIYVNEQYYYSSVLKDQKNSLNQLEQIKIEMSKNRLQDMHTKNRFWDSSLEGFGIEIPHMIAILDMLGIDINSVNWTRCIKYIKDENKYNQGIEIVGFFNKTSIFLSSYLGNFRKDGQDIIENVGIKRYINIIYKDGNKKSINFDPVNGYNRYQSVIKQNNAISVQNDNMLLEFLTEFMQPNNEKTPLKKCNIDNSINLSDRLIIMAQNCIVKNI